jgi:type I restriction enzyme M protein
MARAMRQTSANGAGSAFEATLWTGTGELCGHMAAAEYKQVLLGLVFLRYISDLFEEKRNVPIMNEDRIIIYIARTMETAA